MRIKERRQHLAFPSPESVHGGVRGMLSHGRKKQGMDETLASEIESLRKLKTKALRARFEELFGEEYVWITRQVVLRCRIPAGNLARAVCECDRGDGPQTVPVVD